MTRRILPTWWLMILCVWATAAIFAPLALAPATQVDLTQMFATPGAAFGLGADDLGRSIAARVIAGAAISCPLAALVVIVTTLAGTSFGLLCGWRGGVLDVIGARVMDVFMAFPGFLLAIALAGLLGPGLLNIVVALSVVGWVGYARLARAQTLSLKSREHVWAARALGTREFTLVARHIVPLLAGPILVEAVFGCAATIAQEAGLSFLGLGAQPPTPAWGAMLREAAQFLLVAPHLMLGPGGAIVSLVLAVQAGGEWLRQRWQIPR